ncbi:MAG: ferrochelatase [Myxococcota bacterium]
MVSREKYGVVLLNMGAPESRDGIEPYLFNLFSDPEIVNIPLGSIFRRFLARRIAKKRAPLAAEKYDFIGGKSPLLEETKKQAKKLSECLNIPVSIAMRYSEPRADAALSALSNEGVNKIIALPLYPQFSFSTTRSSIKDIFAHKKDGIEIRTIESYYNDDAYISAMSALLESALSNADDFLKTHILFAAHGIPERYTKRGDPYIGQVNETARLIHKRLSPSMPYSLAFQSRVGPIKWHRPSLDEELENLLKSGVEQVILQPLSFVSENLETLYDLDIEFKQLSQRKGLKSFIRVKTPGDADEFIRALAKIVQTAAAQSGEERNV